MTTCSSSWVCIAMVYTYMCCYHLVTIWNSPDCHRQCNTAYLLHTRHTTLSHKNGNDGTEDHDHVLTMSAHAQFNLNSIGVSIMLLIQSFCFSTNSFIASPIVQKLVSRGGGCISYVGWVHMWGGFRWGVISGMWGGFKGVVFKWVWLASTCNATHQWYISY